VWSTSWNPNAVVSSRSKITDMAADKVGALNGCLAVSRLADRHIRVGHASAS
jgi:hypothetical protein